MEAIRFAHVSDTHLCKDYGNSSMKDVFEKCESPSNTLRNCLEKLEQQKLDFVLFTGDLIHEGTKEDYDYFFEIVKESLPTTKAIYALGNHDRKKPFFESMGLEEKTAYCHVEEIANLRIVVLDSAVEGQETGTISKEQEEWLAGILKNKTTEYGTILAFHHPIVWRTDAFSMQVSDELKEIIKNSDVRAIFCGHTHENSVDFLEKIPQLTADSTAFGSEITPEKFCMVEKTGYSIYTFTKDSWQMHVEQAKEQKVLAAIDMEVLMKLMKKRGEQ